ncbi:MAG: IPExxxVDY family protein [Bacteroidetes bacterium]|nr:IPExxxVDY family protein [Bacteroidota bacterium]
MVKKKGTISGIYENEFVIIGIACHDHDYRLAHFLNKISNFNFIRYNDLMVYQKNNDNPLGFQFYYFDDTENCTNYHFIANRGTEGFLINEWNKIDYLLIVFGSIKKNNLKPIIKQIRKAPIVIAVQEMLITKKIEIDNLMTDLELHIIEIFKKEKEEQQKQKNKLKIQNSAFQH